MPVAVLQLLKLWWFMQQNNYKDRTTVDKHLCQYGPSSFVANQGKAFHCINKDEFNIVTTVKQAKKTAFQSGQCLGHRIIGPGKKTTSHNAPGLQLTEDEMLRKSRTRIVF